MAKVSSNFNDFEFKFQYSVLVYIRKNKNPISLCLEAFLASKATKNKSWLER